MISQNTGDCAGWQLRIATNGWRFQLQLLYSGKWVSIAALDFFSVVAPEYTELRAAQEALRFLVENGAKIHDWRPV